MYRQLGAWRPHRNGEGYRAVVDRVTGCILDHGEGRVKCGILRKARGVGQMDHRALDAMDLGCRKGTGVKPVVDVIHELVNAYSTTVEGREGGPLQTEERGAISAHTSILRPIDIRAGKHATVRIKGARREGGTN